MFSACKEKHHFFYWRIVTLCVVHNLQFVVRGRCCSCLQKWTSFLVLHTFSREGFVYFLFLWPPYCVWATMIFGASWFVFRFVFLHICTLLTRGVFFVSVKSNIPRQWALGHSQWSHIQRFDLDFYFAINVLVLEVLHLPVVFPVGIVHSKRRNGIC